MIITDPNLLTMITELQAVARTRAVAIHKAAVSSATAAVLVFVGILLAIAAFIPFPSFFQQLFAGAAAGHVILGWIALRVSIRHLESATPNKTK